LINLEKTCPKGEALPNALFARLLLAAGTNKYNEIRHTFWGGDLNGDQTGETIE